MIVNKKNTGIPPYGFLVAEFEERMDRAKNIMFDHQLDALVLTAPSNFRYFSGFDSQFWESPTRPWFLIVSIVAPPIAIVPEIGAIEVQKTWIKNIQSWPAPQPSDDGISILAAAIQNLPFRFSRVGMEFGREQSLRMPIIEMQKLVSILRGLEIVNGSPALWELRMVKTLGEIARIKHICNIVSDAYTTVPQIINIGDSEREARRKFVIEIFKRGADSVPFLPAISGPGGISQIVCGPSDRILESGDMLFFDTGSTFDGYFCDFDRNYAIDRVSDEVHRAYEVVWKATSAGIEAAVPGISAEELHQKIALNLEGAGSLNNNAGRFGHGLGLQLTEPPSNMPGDNTVIKPNMVLTIEPSLEYAPGKLMVHEENILITSDGPELLTLRAPEELPIIC